MTDIKISADDLKAIRSCPLFNGMDDGELAKLLSFECCSIRDFSLRLHGIQGSIKGGAAYAKHLREVGKATGEP